ncbi:MAG: choice-of-anchor T family protein [Thermoplasmatota archaeon]
MRPIRTGLLVLSLLTIIAAGFAYFPPQGEVDAAGGALVTVLPDVGMTALHADVDLVRGGIVTFTGSVFADLPLDIDAQYVIVNLEADAGGWETTEIPEIIIARLPSSVPFSVSVIVPKNTSTSGLEASNSLKITGSWSYEPGLLTGTIEPVESFIFVQQFYQYRVTCSDTFIQTSPGGEFDLVLEIYNEGNGDDEITFDLERKEHMENNGWAFIYDQTKWTIPKGGSVKIPISVSTPKKWEMWRNSLVVLHFIITSEQGSYNNEVIEVAQFSVFVRQRGVGIPGFELPVILLSLLLVLSLGLARRRR